MIAFRQNHNQTHWQSNLVNNSKLHSSLNQKNNQNSIQSTQNNPPNKNSLNWIVLTKQHIFNLSKQISHHPYQTNSLAIFNKPLSYHPPTPTTNNIYLPLLMNPINPHPPYLFLTTIISPSPKTNHKVVWILICLPFHPNSKYNLWYINTVKTKIFDHQNIDKIMIDLVMYDIYV